MKKHLQEVRGEKAPLFIKLVLLVPRVAVYFGCFRRNSLGVRGGGSFLANLTNLSFSSRCLLLFFSQYNLPRQSALSPFKLWHLFRLYWYLVVCGVRKMVM